MKLYIFKDELQLLNRMLKHGVYPAEYDVYIQAVQSSIRKIMDGNAYNGKKDDQRVELKLTTRQAYCMYQALQYIIDNDPDELGVIARELCARMAEAEALQPHAGLQLDGTYPSYKSKTPFA